MIVCLAGAVCWWGVGGKRFVLCCHGPECYYRPSAPTHLCSAGAAFNLLAVEANGGHRVEVLVELEAVQRRRLSCRVQSQHDDVESPLREVEGVQYASTPPSSVGTSPSTLPHVHPHLQGEAQRGFEISDQTAMCSVFFL